MSIKVTRGTIDHGSNLDVDTTAEALTSTSFKPQRGVLIKADSSNTGIVYVGLSDVTAGSESTTDGIPLEAGESIEIEIDDISNLYTIGSANNQKVYWMAV